MRFIKYILFPLVVFFMLFLGYSFSSASSAYLPVQFSCGANFTPADSISNRVGSPQSPSCSTSTSTNVFFTVPFDTTLVSLEGVYKMNNVGSGEPMIFGLTVIDFSPYSETFYPLHTFNFASQIETFSTSTSIFLQQGQQIFLQTFNPAWATNPTALMPSFTALLEYSVASSTSTTTNAYTFEVDPVYQNLAFAFLLFLLSFGVVSYILIKRK